MFCFRFLNKFFDVAAMAFQECASSQFQKIYLKNLKQNTMNKKYLFIAFLFVTTIGNAQARIGFSENDIRFKEFPHKKFTSFYTDKNVYTIRWEDEDLTAVYYFNDKRICKFCVIFTKTNRIVNYLVQKYNNDFVIISNTEWRQYASNRIISIRLLYTEYKEAYFSFSLLDE